VRLDIRTALWIDDGAEVALANLSPEVCELAYRDITALAIEYYRFHLGLLLWHGRSC
jgi:hypothetical protein